MASASPEIPRKPMPLNTAPAYDEHDLHNHVMMAELMMDSTAGPRKLGPARSLLSDETAASVDLWFGYDVHYKSHPSQRTYGNITPRYVGSRNQVLGGLYFQQVSKNFSYISHDHEPQNTTGEVTIRHEQVCDQFLL